MSDEGQEFDDGLEPDSEAMAQISTALMAAKVLERSREEGVPMSELALDTQGGKIRAVTQREKRAAGEARRKELIKKLRQRAVRGDNNLAEDITKRLRHCQEWIDYISRFSSVSEKDLLSIKRNIESTNNRAISLVKEVTILETAIRRKKEEDPIINQVESASAGIMEAIKEQNFEQVAELRQFCEQNIPVYNLRKKRLKPYLTQARQARKKFFAEKRNVMRMQYETGGQVLELLANDLSNGKFAQFDSEALQHITHLIHKLRELRSQARPKMAKLSQPIGNVALSFLDDLEKEMKDVDETILIPFEEHIEQLMSSVGIALKVAREQEEKALAKKKKEEEKRMAFQQKQKKEKEKKEKR